MRPLDGAYAAKGKCCYRVANSTRIKAQGDGPLDTIEYRVAYQATTNQPQSLGLGAINADNIFRINNEQLNVLWQFKGPREGGKSVSGPGKLRIGIGRSNCDGTYSFYSDKAAPAVASLNNPARWQSKEFDSVIDASKQEPDRVVPVWSMNPNREYTYLPYLNAGGSVDWEVITQGFTIDKMPTDDSALDCIGEIKSDGSGWKGGGTLTAYVPMEANDSSGIPLLNGQTTCQLLAFGAVLDVTSPKSSCKTTPREAPVQDSSACASDPKTKSCWVKLPDSLCPASADEKSKWGCHVGYEGNPDKEPTKCTHSPVTAALDPALGPVTTEGQCCDPLGKQSSGLPACNAWVTRNDFAAAAVKITAKDADALQKSCL
ncbi:MAG TPA: hypothetical protein VF331_15900 [Polyangiales bacterium]